MDDDLQMTTLSPAKDPPRRSERNKNLLDYAKLNSGIQFNDERSDVSNDSVVSDVSNDSVEEIIPNQEAAKQHAILEQQQSIEGEGSPSLSPSLTSYAPLFGSSLDTSISTHTTTEQQPSNNSDIDPLIITHHAETPSHIETTSSHRMDILEGDITSLTEFVKKNIQSRK